MSQADRRRAKQRARAAAETLPLRFAVSRETFEVLSSEWGGVSRYDGRTGNVDAKTGIPLFSMKSRPGFAPCRSERGTTVRTGGTLKFQRENPAKGEERMPRETLAEKLWRTVECVERDPESPDYGTIAECIVATVQTNVTAEIRAGNHVCTPGTGERMAQGSKE